MSTSHQLKYFPGLDGLRGISCLIVVLTHNFEFSHFFEYGWLGVDLFFVISGFLITSILLNAVQSENFLRNFYVRRILRIFPLYYLMLVIFIIILPLFNPFKEELQYYVQNQLWFWFYGQNWLMIFRFPPTGAYHLNHFWSLAVEEQFYLLWPFIILWLRTPKRLTIFIVAALVALFLVRSFLWYLKIDQFNYTVFYRFTRVDGICIGALCATILKINKRLISNNIAIVATTLALLNLAFYFVNKHNEFTYPYLGFIGYTTFSALLGLLLNEVIQNKAPWFQAIFTFPALQFVGKISYSLYALHWPVFLLTHSLFSYVFQNTVGLSGLVSVYTASFCSTILGFILSVVSYYYFERKFLRLKNRF
jgi:peptidoglycan/LPS O-acetylase OafA/YrhL